MNPSLGYRLFTLAKSIGVMSEGYAWIISDSLSNFMNSMDSVTRESMQGVLGIRPYIYHSRELGNFQQRWKRNMLREKDTGSIVELNVYGLWAYDALTALAIAVEKIGPINSTSFYLNKSSNGTDSTNLRISIFGPALLSELLKTKFKGLTGDFELVNRKLKQSVIEIFNVYGSGEKSIGFWSPDRGIIRDLSSNRERNYSRSTKGLKNVIWPGDSVLQPKGWAIPTTGNLRVGVPWRPGFTEFVSLKIDPATNHTNATGFAIDIFLATLEILPFPLKYEFRPYNGTTKSEWTDDDMLREIPRNFDMVVGDTTIWAPRTYVDFSLPYTESGVILVIKNKKTFDMFIFTKPLNWDLWLAILGACILMGIVLRILEHRVTINAEDPNQANIERPKMIYLSPVAVLAFPERNMVTNSWSLFVLVFWLFMAFILMQSYTANLAAILTVDQLKFAFSDDSYVGVRTGSFTKQVLTEELHFRESTVKSYSSVEEFHDAMSKGSKNGGIDVIIDEIPYMKLFLKKYDSQYKMIEPAYRTGGFGFAFPVGSPLVSHFSKAILNVTQGRYMTAIEQKNFGPGYSSQDPLSSTITQGTSSLTFYQFAGLFLIVGSITIFSLFCSETPIGRKLVESIECLINFITGYIRRLIRVICFGFRTSTVHDGDIAEAVGEDKCESMQNNPSDSSPMVGHAIAESSGQNDDVIHEIGPSDEEDRIDSDKETRNT